MIIQNRDEVEVTLQISQMSSPGEFRDLISSLSPEMQRFAKAYRVKQLAGTLTAVAVIQIKPHLEQLLNLPEGSLTKEISLTQDVIKLLVEYQIPSDLISFDSSIMKSTTSIGTLDKLEQVKQLVGHLMDMIESKLNDKLKSKTRERKYYDNVEEAFDESAQPEKVELMARVGSGDRVARGMPKKKKRVIQSDPINERIDDPVGSYEVQHSIPETNTIPTKNDDSKDSPNPTKTHEKPSLRVTAVDDFTTVPFRLESNMLQLDPKEVMKPSKITLSNWQKHSRDLFGKDSSVGLKEADLKLETNRAFDLIDSLTKTADLPLEDTEVHVFLTVTHDFEEVVLENVIKNNENIIESAEASLLVLASTIHGVKPSQLVKETAIPRLQNYTSYLFPKKDI